MLELLRACALLERPKIIFKAFSGKSIEIYPTSAKIVSVAFWCVYGFAPCSVLKSALKMILSRSKGLSSAAAAIYLKSFSKLSKDFSKHSPNFSSTSSLKYFSRASCCCASLRYSLNLFFISCFWIM